MATLLAGVLVAGLLLPYSLGLGLASNKITNALAATPAAGIDVRKLAVTGCSRLGKGAFVVGVLCLLIGLPFVVAPVAVGGAIGSLLERLEAHSTLGADLAGYLMTDGLSGRFVLLGLFMVGLGAVSHSARRAGRREPEIVDRVRRA